MTRQWKPGDVAWVYGEEPSGRSTIEFSEVGIRAPGHGWSVSDGVVDDAWVHDARSLVVIDPKDREQVERLVKIVLDEAPAVLVKHATENGSHVEWRVADMQAALREFANPKPPKPAEPKGLGAVVEDIKGARWVRLSDNFWRSGIGIAAITSNEWERIDAVRVLSEGVSDD